MIVNLFKKKKSQYKFKILFYFFSFLFYPFFEVFQNFFLKIGIFLKTINPISDIAKINKHNNKEKKYLIF